MWLPLMTDLIVRLLLYTRTFSLSRQNLFYYMYRTHISHYIYIYMNMYMHMHEGCRLAQAGETVPVSAALLVSELRPAYVEGIQ